MAAGEHFRRPCSSGHALQACFPHPPGPRCVDPSRIQRAQGSGCPSPSFQKCDSASAHMPWERTGAKGPPLGVRGSGGAWPSPRQPRAQPRTCYYGKRESGIWRTVRDLRHQRGPQRHQKINTAALYSPTISSSSIAPTQPQSLQGTSSGRLPRARHLEQGNGSQRVAPPGCVCPDPEQQLRLEGRKVGRRRDREPQGSRTPSQLDSLERELTSGEATRLVQVTSVFGAGKGTAPSMSNSELLFFPQLLSFGNH